MGTSIDGQPEISGRGLHQSGDSIDLASQFLSAGKKGHDKRKRGHSQKAMLSKALQKANTAVLLDNAANFEGAMEAYNDACQLLQLVMLRSNGGEDEKLKLQEIVSLHCLFLACLKPTNDKGKRRKTKSNTEGYIYDTSH